jgi:hypothetical protein
MPVDPSAAFYQTLTGTSFTLLGLWVAVLQLVPSWRTDPARHASTVHLTLKFFLPGVLGLASLLGSTSSSALVWRVSFAVGGMVGVVEAVHFLLRGGGRPAAIRRLAVLDPPLYGLVVTVALVPTGAWGFTPLQAEGVVVTLVFVTGLLGVWIVLAERAPAPAPGPAVGPPAGPPGGPPRPDRRPGPPPVRTWQPPGRRAHPRPPTG